jgi:[ribosomal protein S5]-alanine N-acetyltransferase
MGTSKIVIETDRLTLRHLRPDDVDPMHAYLGDPETMKYYPAPYSREFVKRSIEQNLERDKKYGYGLFGVLLKSSGQLIGDCGLVWQDLPDGSELEVGYHFHPDHWGHGYATEAAKACIDYAFSNAGVDHIISLIRPENTPSRRVAERNGLRIVRQVVWKDILHDVWQLEKNLPLH